MRYLSARQILLLHSRLLDATGGSAGIRDVERVNSVVNAPKQEVFGQAQYETVYQKAAVYIRNITQDRPFVDGDKRTAMLCGLTFIEQNGYVTNFSTGEIEKMAVQVATKNLDIVEIAAWLEAHSSVLK